MFSRKPQQVVAWTSTKTKVENANKQFAQKSAEMAAQGYAASAPLIGEAGRSKKSWLALEARLDDYRRPACSLGA
jgi:hypothetical protein